MAVLFGYQFVFTAILTVLLQKLSPIFSPGLNMITGFYRFVVPSDDDLKPFVSNKNSKDMRIPNDSGLQLNMHQTSRNHVAFLPFFNDFTWLIDFSLVAVVCFIGTEAYFQLGFNPSAVLHMGLIWVLVVFYLTVSILISMTKQYIQSKSGEMSVIMTCTSLALVASMICLISDKHMDFGLNESFQTFDLHLKKFYSEAFTDGKAPSGDSVQSYRGPSSMIFNGWLAITSTVLAGLLTFPGLKAAQMFSLLFKKERTLDQGIAVVNFATPFIVVLMYLKPVKYFYLDPNYFTLKNDDQAGSSSSTSMEELIATKEGSFKLFRALVILSLCAIKFITFKFYLQEYLISPKKELDEIRKDVGYTKTSKIQEEVKKVNLSTCITACQYMIPTVVVGFLCLFLVGSSDVRVLPSFEGKSDSLIGQLIALESQSHKDTPWTKLTNSILGETDTTQILGQKSIKLSSLLKIFNPVFFNGVVNYLLWFTCLYLSITSLLGLNFYYRKFSDDKGGNVSGGKLSTKKVEVGSPKKGKGKRKLN